MDSFKNIGGFRDGWLGSRPNNGSIPPAHIPSSSPHQPIILFSTCSRCLSTSSGDNVEHDNETISELLASAPPNPPNPRKSKIFPKIPTFSSLFSVFEIGPSE